MFHFSYDPYKNLVEITQQGYWSTAIFEAFETEFLALHASIRSTRGHYRVIADCRDFPVQSPEITESFRILFERRIAENQGRYAIVLHSMLNKLQAKRALPQPNVHMFIDRDEAMTWLFEEGSLPD